MNEPLTADAVRKRMEQIRSDLGQDLEQVVHNARTMVDWRHYVKSHPWVCLGAAAALGFLIFPRRPRLISPDAQTLAELAKRSRLVIESTPKAGAKDGMIAALVGTIAHSMLRGAMGYLGHHAEQMWKTGGPLSDRDAATRSNGA